MNNNKNNKNQLTSCASPLGLSLFLPKTTLSSRTATKVSQLWGEPEIDPDAPEIDPDAPESDPESDADV